MAAPTLHQLALLIHFGDSIQLYAGFRDVEIPVRVLNRVGDIIQLKAGIVAADLSQLDALGRVYPDAVIMRIADDQVAVPVDAEPAGAAVAVIRRGPSWAEVLAVAIEDLDASGKIDDEKPVLRIDGGSARFDE